MLRVKNLTVVSKLARKIKKISDIPIRSFCTVGKRKKKKKKIGQAAEKLKRREEEVEGEWEGRGTKILFQLT